MKESRILQAALSRQRWSTYERIASRCVSDPATLYAWNMQMCAALLPPLHIYEVVIRNAAATALVHRYGRCWPWHPALLRSLPAEGALASLCEVRGSAGAPRDVPEVIAKLRFGFWQQLFARRFEHSIWAGTMGLALPHAPSVPLSVLRRSIHADLDRIRHLRNRIAHHEPITSPSSSATSAPIWPRSGG